MRISTRLSRRNLLRAGSAAVILTPFLRSLEALAQTAPPKRLIVFATPNGTVMNSFFTTGTTYGPILAPLQPLQPKLLVMRGIDMKSAQMPPVLIDHLPHCSNQLTGVQPLGTGYTDFAIGGISVDQHIANVLNGKTKVHSKQLGVVEHSSVYPISAGGPRQPKPPELNPYRAYTSLFEGVGGADAAALNKARADRKSVLDFVTGELGAIRCELGGEDRIQFDAHLESIREIERGLDFQSTSACTPPLQGAAMPTNDSTRFPELAKLQMNLTVAAVACDITRVITLQMSRGGSSMVHRWLDLTGTHHGIGHNSEGVNATEATRLGWLVEIENWFAQQFFYLVSKLDGIAEGTSNKTLLDNSAVLWTHEQANGATHAVTDMPYVLAGSCGGYFRTGRNLNLGGVAHNNLLLSLAEAMDAPTNTIGVPELCTGPLAELR